MIEQTAQPVPPPGYRVRPPRPMDAAAVAALKRADDLDRHGDSDSSEHEVLEEWSLPRLRLDEDVWLVETGRGDLAGYAFVYQEDPPSLFFSGPIVHPSHRGRGIDELLLGCCERRAREVAAAADPPAAATLCVSAYEKDVERIELYEARGYRHVRTFTRLLVALDGPVAEPDWPPGIVVRLFCRGRDEADVHAAVTEAFQDHWHPDEMDLDEWLTFRFERPDLDLTLWWVAWEGDEVAGTILAFETQLGGYIDELAVRRPWRRRGLGRALLLQCFAELRRRGQPAAYLGVDLENPTGATHLYASLGMTPSRGSHLVYERALPAP